MSTFENDLRLEEIGTGERSGTWGTATNVNLELIANALSYSATGEAIANASTHTITMQDGTADEFRSFYLKCTGGGQACTVTLAPNTLSKVWMIENTTSFTLTFSQGSGANVAVLSGQVKMIATDGAGSGGAVFDLMQDLAVPDLFVDDDITLQSDAAVLGFGVNKDVTLTHVHDAGLLLNAAMKMQFRDAAISVSSSADATLDIASDGAINLTAGTDVVIPANVGITFGTGEKIEGDSTDLTITSGAKINLTATSDVVVPANVGITFGTGEKIEGDNTDLTITSGAKINLAATSDVHLANNIGMVFGDAGEKIEGDGTNLAINSSGDVNITATTVDLDGNLEVSGTITLGSGAVISEAELELLDGLTPGTAIASKVVTTDASIDTSGQNNLTITGELDAATGDFSGIVDVAGVLTVSNTTASSSSTSGSLIVGGGLGVAADLFVGDDFDVTGDAVIDGTTLVTGVLTTTAATVFNGGFASNADSTMGTNKKIIFRDSAIHISSTADGDMSIAADDEIDITSTLIDINGNVEISGTTAQVGVLTTTATQVATGGITSGSNIVSDTDSTDDLGTTSVRWANLFVDGITATDQITATGFTGTLDGILGSGAAATASVTTLDTSGAVNLNLATDSTSSTSGALIVDGGVGVAKKLFVGTDFDVSGNAVIDGTALVTGILTTTAKAVSNGGIGMPDSAKLTFGGTGTGDLQIFHNGTDSVIQEAVNNRRFLIGGDEISVRKGDLSDDMATFVAGGAVTLFHNNAAKLATASGGVTVTGEVAAATLDISGAVDIAGQSTVAGGAVSAPSYSFTGDPDTGISRPTADAVNIVTGGTERVRIDSSGRVGIGGTPNTSWRNDISNQEVLMLGTEATLFADGGVTTQLVNNAFINNSDTFLNISTRGASQYQQYQGIHKWFTAASANAGSNINTEFTTPKMVLDVGGNLGINISSPLDLLHLNDPNDDCVLNLDTAQANKNSIIKFSDPDAQGRGFIQYAHSDDSLRFIVAGTDRMRIDSSGSLIKASGGLIKTDGTASLLEITGSNATNTGANIHFHGNTHANASQLHFKNGSTTVLIVGSGTVQTPTSGTSNVKLGVNAGNSIVSGGNFNVCLGDEAGTALSTGDNNIAIGFRALKSEDNNGSNIAIGSDALENLDAGADAHNVAIGNNAANDLTTGVRNTIIGSIAGDQATTIDDCVIIGYNAGGNATMTGHDNVFIGKDAGQEMAAGVSNVHIGRDSGQASTAGSYNVSIGDQAYQANQDSDYNVAIGFEALQENTAGNGQNTAVGAQTLTSSVSGYNNTAIGVFSMGNANVTGIHNTGLGYAAGFGITGGSNNTFLGSESGRSGSPGGNITTASNTITLGDNNVATANIKVDWTVSSDQRDKTDFTALDLGLDFVKALNPVTFKWDSRSKYLTDDNRDTVDLDTITNDGTHKEDWTDVGFKAQEVVALEEAAGYTYGSKANLTTNLTSDGKQYGIQYSKFIPILVKAMQEQNALIEALTARIATLEG